MNIVWIGWSYLMEYRSPEKPDQSISIDSLLASQASQKDLNIIIRHTFAMHKSNQLEYLTDSTSNIETTFYERIL